MTPGAPSAVGDALRLLHARFLNRTDLVAIHAPWGKPFPVDANRTLDDLLLAHLLGEAAPVAKVAYSNRRGAGVMAGHYRVGSYSPATDGTTRWVCLDFDGAGHANALADPQAAALLACDAFAAAGLPSYLERSGGGTGWHVWCFFDPPLPAGEAQALGRVIAPKQAPLAGSSAFADARSARGIEVFPKQSKLSRRGFGNLVWLPWWHGAPAGANAFYRRAHDRTLEPYVPTELEVAAPEAVERLLAQLPVPAVGPRPAPRPGTGPRPDKGAKQPPPPPRPRPAPDAAATGETGTTGDSVWGAWRRKALAALPLEPIYAAWLTGRAAGVGWLECRDPASPSGDQTPSAGVADGAGEAERGTFHSFIDERSLSVFDFLVAHGGVADFRAARARVADLSGVQAPPGGVPVPPAGIGEHPAGVGEPPAGVGATGSDEPSGKQGRRPEIQINDRLLDDIVRDAWRAVHDANSREPTMFVRDGALVRIGHGEQGRRIEHMTEVSVFGHLGNVADWVRVTDYGSHYTLPSKDAARAMLDVPDPSLPSLNAIVSTPVFTPQGTLVATPGYHREARVWYEPPHGLVIPQVPEQPTAAAVAQARSLLLSELLGEFPFVDASAKAHMVAAILLPFARRLIQGATPIHLVESPTEGTGKGLLVDMIAIIATGVAACGGSLPESEDEVRKKIGSELSSGRPLLLLDNGVNKRSIDSAALASATTMWPTWTDRLLGQIKMFTVPNDVVWILTANNPRLSRELTRRSVSIRIDAGIDRPWLRKGYRHAKLVRWAHGHRAELIHAALLLIQNWIAQGRPAGSCVMGRFEEWSEIMGGIVTAAGIEGFLGNLDVLYATTDADGAMWSDFLAAWWDAYQDRPVRVAELVELCARGEFMARVLGDGSVKSQTTRLGNALQNARDRVFEGLRIEFAGRDSISKRPTYRAVEILPTEKKPT